MPILLPNIRQAGNKKFIQCAVRRKWIVLTPEEKVRQYTLHQLVNQLEYPLKYISVEKAIRVHELSKRYDIVVFNRELQASVLIECKAEYIDLKEKTLQQIANYNIRLKVPYLMVTNGFVSHYFEVREAQSRKIETLPPFGSL